MFTLVVLHPSSFIFEGIFKDHAKYKEDTDSTYKYWASLRRDQCLDVVILDIYQSIDVYLISTYIYMFIQM